MEQSFLSKPTWHIAATTRDKNINCSISETLPTVQKCVWNVKYFYSKDKDKNDVNLLNDGTRNRPIWLLDKRAPLTNNADKITLTAVITFYADQRISNAGNTWTEKHGRKSTASSRHLKKKKRIRKVINHSIHQPKHMMMMYRKARNHVSSESWLKKSKERRHKNVHGWFYIQSLLQILYFLPHKRNVFFLSKTYSASYTLMVRSR